MQKTQPSDRVRQVATRALLNALEFCAANFAREAERHIIMQVFLVVGYCGCVNPPPCGVQVICEATQSTDQHTAVAALQSLVKIAALYYDYLEQYMATALLGVRAAGV